MIVLGLALLGAIFGSLLAKRRKGASKDLLQYAASYAILFAIIGLFVTVFVHRAAL